MECELIKLPQHIDDRGILTWIPKLPHDLEVKHVFFVTDTKFDRGDHAHRSTWQLVVCVTGEMWIETITKRSKNYYVLWGNEGGLLIPPMTWVEYGMENEAVALILMSFPHDEKDCIRDYGEFMDECYAK